VEVDMVRLNRLHLVFGAAALLSWLAATALVLGAPPHPAAQQSADARISADDAAALLARRAAVLLDVRDEGMFTRGHLPGARLVPPDQWREVGRELRNTTELVITYCSCPAEETSLRAAAVLLQNGVPRVRALTGGFEGWEASGRTVVRPGQTVAEPAGGQTRQPTQLQGEANRDRWQRVPDIFDAMGVREGAVVADVGAGSGYFTTRLATAVGPTGRVLAVDISANALRSLERRVKADGLANVELVEGTPADPRLPAGALDAALIVNAYHEMTEHQAMLAAIRLALKPTGRLVIVEPIEEGARGASRASQERNHQIAPLYVQQDAIAAGFVIVRVEDPFTRRQGNMPEYLVALAPAPAATGEMPAHEHAPAMSEPARRPDDVVAALALRPGQVVVDLGAGSGLFTRRFARAVGPSGRAIGLDIEPAVVEALKRDAAALGLANYEARLVAADNPGIPAASADVIFLSNTYHHVEQRVAYFTKLRDALKPGGRLVIVDFPPSGSGLPDHPDRRQVEAELASAGYRLRREHTFLERQFFLEFVVR
jgi:ubiquinone/menaquinone biosynthesis C-methylase UbiE/rhodanese-related sulfurtransferase